MGILGGSKGDPEGSGGGLKGSMGSTHTKNPHHSEDRAGENTTYIILIKGNTCSQAWRGRRDLLEF